jgi:hypothetical protein
MESVKKIIYWDDFTSYSEQLKKKQKVNAFKLVTKF